MCTSKVYQNNKEKYSLIEHNLTITRWRFQTLLHKKEGRSATGCFFRDGTSSTSMSEEEVERRWKLSFSNEDLLQETQATCNTLSFRQLKIFYDEVGMTLNDDTIASNLGLLTKDGHYNKSAELL